MRKVLTTFSFIVISLFLLSLFGWMSIHVSKGDKDFGFLTAPVKYMVSFPDLFTESVEEVKTRALPKTFVPTPEDFKPVNKLSGDCVILTTYSDTSDSRTIALLNLKNDSTLYKWTVNNPFKEHKRIWNPLVFKDKSLVYSFEGFSGLRRIDSLGNLIWKQDSVYAHHSMNLDSAGNIWICSFAPVFYATGMYKLNGRSVFFKDNYITRVNAQTGRILFHKSMVKILNDNGLSHYIIKSANIFDPLHINDVEPALKTTRYYREGDIFISAKNPSFIMHYRPSTNTVIKMIEGPFSAQHDVDFYGDSSLVFFNNNNYTIWLTKSKPPPRDSSRLEFAGDFYSNIGRYDFWNDSISFIGESVFRNNHIFTGTEGLIQFVDPETYFVEEQNSGLLWIIRNDEVIYKNVLPSQHKGFHHLPNWNRVIYYHE